MNNNQVDDAKYLDVVIPMYNFIEYSDNYSKTFVNWWQYYGDEWNANLTNSKSFKSKVKIAGKTLLMVTQKMLK